jgi:hypothetical protein
MCFKGESAVAVSFKNLNRRTPRDPSTWFFRAVTVLFLPASVFAALAFTQDIVGENTALFGPVLESPCAKLPVPCNMLCQEARSKGSRAAGLEEMAAAARSKADMAKKRAAYFDNLAEKRMMEAQKPNKKSYRALLQSANILLRYIVPKYSRISSQSDSILNQSSTSRNRKREEKVATEARERADEAMIAADEAVMAAYEAARESMTARAAADAARKSYAECSCR